MEIQEFRAALQDVAAFLVAMRKLNPKRVDQELITHLDRLQDDPVGLENLRNSLSLPAPKS